MSLSTSLDVIFLGTAAGKPSTTRNVSSLGLRLDGEVWLVDAGEAETLHQLIDQRNRWIKLSKITRIFITHCHGDHIYGLPGLLSTIDDTAAPGSTRVTEIYGPKGLREFLGTTFRISSSEMPRPYRVHELLLAGEQPTPPHPLEASGGRAIVQAADRTWHVSDGAMGTIEIRAAPIVHRVPCIGYVFRELPGYRNLDMSAIQPVLDANAEALRAQGVSRPSTLLSRLKEPDAEALTLPDGSRIEPAKRDRPGRKVVVLGDTSDPHGPMETLAHQCDLLVHEATNVRIDASVSLELATKGETEATCRERMISRGHSTPQMAGDYAKRVRAKMLVLNHLSPRLRPDVGAVIDVVRQSATAAWESGTEALVARDYMVIEIPKVDSGRLASVVAEGTAR